MTTPQDIELVYYDAKGRGQSTRLMLAVAGIPFKDTRLSDDDADALIATGTLPLGTLPVLKFDGRIVSCQSLNMLRIVAKLSGSLEMKSEDALVGEEILATAENFLTFVNLWYDGSEEEKVVYEREIIATGFVYYAKYIDSLLAQHHRQNGGCSSGPFLASTMSCVDIYVYAVIDVLQDMIAHAGKLPWEGLTELSALMEAVAAVPAVKSYP
ncbi:glutathione S-transferase, putative [Bodo saltans]|uniref:Glutathione S-transferase, putative n=1 Tax=Bodo saltans TaxID=75058 RepID=A0A0S4JML4_BODSA|nr:glutathione S-transferase, putative [Bodo saltans]|eukprot:CUG91448.1 glutathione S-transferase, putative [Bodo saltans]